jgi:hypothetical protein
VADVTPLRAAHEAGLAHRERREVVVVPVELLRLEPEGVQPHLLLQRAERGHAEGLRLAAGEERRAVGAREQTGLDRDRSDLLRRAAVGTDLLDRDALAHRVLLDLREGLGDLRALVAVLDVRSELAEDLLLDGLGRVLTGELVLDRGRLVDLGAVLVGDLLEQVLVDRDGLDLELVLADELAHLDLDGAQLLDRVVRDVECVEDLGLGHLVGAGLDHEDRLFGAGNDQVEVAVALG